MENILFVKHVKDLLTHLEYATRVLLPDMTEEALGPNSQVRASTDTHVAILHLPQILKFF